MSELVEGGSPPPPSALQMSFLRRTRGPVALSEGSGPSSFGASDARWKPHLPGEKGWGLFTCERRLQGCNAELKAARLPRLLPGSQVTGILGVSVGRRSGMGSAKA